ncbi:type II secretion system F family protein [Candidatus Woesearchaeota archaeon]|nr:type II secretion system F family protein [Candidatus Woesearchaeota archaeon]
MIHKLLGYVYPKRMRESYDILLAYNHFNYNVEKFLGSSLIIITLITAVLSVLIEYYLSIPWYISAIIIFFLFQIYEYVLLVLHSDRIASKVEEIIPDALHLISSNLRSGLTIDQALILSARPEFGPLQREIYKVGKDITLGVPIEKALTEFGYKIKSDKLRKTIQLIITGLRSGGELSSLLEETAENLRQQNIVEQKIRSSVAMYFIFIFAAVGIGGPILFSLSSFLIEILSKVLGEITVAQNLKNALPISLTKVSIGSDFIIMFSIISLVTTSILSSLVLGLILKGKEREGTKYIPILVLITVAVFYIVRYLMGKLLSSLLLF